MKKIDFTGEKAMELLKPLGDPKSVGYDEDSKILEIEFESGEMWVFKVLVGPDFSQLEEPEPEKEEEAEAGSKSSDELGDDAHEPGQEDH